MIVSPNSGMNSGLLQSLLQNPQLLQNLIPGVNLQALAATLQVALAQEEAPLQNLAQEQVTLTGQSQAWSQVSSALAAVQNDLQALSLPADFSPTSAPESSDPSVVTASGTGAAPGVYTVTVSNLAVPGVSDSSFVAGSSGTALGDTGDIVISYGGASATVTVSSGDSLATIANNLAQAASTISGFDANVSLLPASSSSGGSTVSGWEIAITDAGNFTVSSSVSGPVTLGFTQPSGTPAVYTVNGVQNTSWTNTVPDALGPGTSLTLLAPTSGNPVTITVSPDPAQVASKVNQLVSDIQAAIATLGKVAGKGGALEGQASLIAVGQQLVGMLTQVDSALPPGYQSLTDLGLTVSWSQSTGQQIQFDSSTFTQALANNSGAVTALFAGSSGSPGIVAQMQSYLEAFLNPSTGIIASAQQAITTEEQSVTNQQQTLQQLVQMEQATADQQFMAALQTLLREAGLQQSLQAQLNAAAGLATTSSSTGSGTSGP